MSIIKKTVLPVILSTVWISVNEFVRNQLVFQDDWVKHYSDMGLTFPAEPINGAVWGIWSLCFAIAIYVVAQKFSLTQTTLLSWFVGFVLMWLVIGNMDVLPMGLLVFAVPWSIVEAYGASFIIHRLAKSKA